MLGFGLFGRIWVRIGPKGDEALRIGQGGRTDGQMDGWMERFLCVLQDFVSFGAAAQKVYYFKSCKESKKHLKGIEALNIVKQYKNVLPFLKVPKIFYFVNYEMTERLRPKGDGLVLIFGHLNCCNLVTFDDFGRLQESVTCDL